MFINCVMNKQRKMVNRKKDLEEKASCFNISAKKSHIDEIDAHVEKMGLNSRSSFLISNGLKEVRKSGRTNV